MLSYGLFFFFFFKQKTAYELLPRLEFRRVLFRSEVRLDPPAPPPIEVPPPGPVGDKVQNVVRGPRRLEDGLVLAARDPPHLAERPIVPKRGDRSEERRVGKAWRWRE